MSFLAVQTIASLEQKAKGIDADGDGKVRARALVRGLPRVVLIANVQVDLNELRAFLSDAGALDIFGANSVQEVMSIFDTDGNGTLEKEEMASLMEFIEEEKARLLELGANKDCGGSGTSLISDASAGVKNRRRGSVSVADKKLLTVSKLEKSLDAVDQDGDGIVDLEEVSICVLCC